MAGFSNSCLFSGGRGIRTPGPRKGTPVFKTGAFVRSAIPPLANVQIVTKRESHVGGYFI